ncbi:MAG: TonB-dependent receptor [Synechococcales bacterium]|nr:TonB-dependent receptor [Synechococcales bacterium]
MKKSILWFTVLSSLTLWFVGQGHSGRAIAAEPDGVLDQAIGDEIEIGLTGDRGLAAQEDGDEAIDPLMARAAIDPLEDAVMGDRDSFSKNSDYFPQNPVVQTFRRNVSTTYGAIAQSLPANASGAIAQSLPANASGAIAQSLPSPFPTTLDLKPTTDSRIPADARSRVTLSGQVLDQTGQPFLADVLITLSTSAGKFIGADQDTDRPGHQVVARDGKFSVELQSNLEPQKVRVRAAIDQQFLKDLSAKLPAGQFSLPNSTPVEVYTQVEFITNLRPAIVSGSLRLWIGAEGTDYYDSFRNFLKPGAEGVGVNASAAVFATGAIGDWLFTGAYNSQRNLNETCDGTTSLFRADQFCDQVYPVYGDSSTVDFLTPSIDSVYLKLERTSPVPGAGSDFAMWGDYKSTEFARSSQLFTATQRNLHGFKANYNLGNLQATLMYGNNLQGFQRDGITPNGTSGYYFLSRRLVLTGSENIFIETEELNRPGTVINRVNLSRGRDYEIDYDRGSILFRRPILATEIDLFGNTLVRRIIVTYQYEGTNTGDTKLYAGRLQYNLDRGFNRESWIAGSYLREDLGNRDFELYGADAQIRFGKDSQLVAEIAQSRSINAFRGEIKGTAYRIDAKAQFSEAIAARVYYRSVDEGFTNSSTFSFAPGQTRYGAELAAKLGSSTQLQASFDHEVNYGIAAGARSLFDLVFNPQEDPLPGTPLDNSLTTIRAGVTQKLGTAALSLDWVNRKRDDRIANRLTEDSNQLVTRFTYPITKNLLFRAQNEMSLGSQRDPLYPDRTTVGVDWKAFPGVTLRVAQQFLSGGDFLRNSITTFDTLIEQNITEDTSLTGRYSVLNGINGWSSQGAIGLQHRWKITPGLRIHLGYERIFGDVFTYTAAGQQFAQPYSIGQSSSSLGLSSGDSYSIGFEYTDNPDFKASARYERRNSTNGNNTLITAAAIGKVSPSLTLLGRYQQTNASNQEFLGVLGDTKNLKVGLAYRNPRDDKFNLLLRYEYRENPDVTPNTLLFGTGSGSQAHLGAVEAIYAPNFRWEFYGKFGIRSSKSYLASDLVGTNTISLAQFRTSYRLGYNWDLVGELRWSHQTATRQGEMGALVEVGYYLTPNLRVAAGYSFGSADDIDFNGTRSRGGAFLNLSLKLNDLFGFGVQPIAPKQQQESVISNTPPPPTIKTTLTEVSTNASANSSDVLPGNTPDDQYETQSGDVSGEVKP